MGKSAARMQEAVKASIPEHKKVALMTNQPLGVLELEVIQIRKIQVYLNKAILALLVIINTNRIAKREEADKYPTITLYQYWAHSTRVTKSATHCRRIQYSGTEVHSLGETEVFRRETSLH